MQDFNSFANGGGSNNKNTDNLSEMISALAGKYNGASEAELSNADIDRFAAMLSPMLDEKKRAYLKKIVAELKKI